MIKKLIGYLLYKLIARKPKGDRMYLYDENGRFIRIIR